MKKTVLALLLLLASGVVFGAGGYADLMKARVDVSDEASLQRGAALFTNLCISCHSAKYVRWNALPDALGVSMEMVEDNLIYGSYQEGNMMQAAMREADAERWFGASAPDLSLTARSRGADWVYTYLNSFYRDPDASSGWNNTLLVNSSMPHVMWTLQGVPEAKFEEVGDEIAVAGIRVPEQQAGMLSEEQFQQATRDITNFMAFLAEPIRAKRQEIGVWVIGFLVIFTFLAYLLKREYWRDIH